MILNICFIFFISFVSSGCAEVQNESKQRLRSYDIVTLASNNFTSYLSQNSNVLVYFNSESDVEANKNSTRELKLFIAVFNITNTDIIVAEMDIKNNPNLQQNLMVNSTPSFRLYTERGYFYNLPSITDFDHSVFWIEGMYKSTKNEILELSELEELKSKCDPYSIFIGSLICQVKFVIKICSSSGDCFDSYEENLMSANYTALLTSVLKGESKAKSKSGVYLAPAWLKAYCQCKVGHLCEDGNTAATFNDSAKNCIQTATRECMMSEIAECICQQGNKSLSTKFENNTQYSNLILIDICWKENVFAHFIFENGTVDCKRIMEWKSDRNETSNLWLKKESSIAKPSSGQSQGTDSEILQSEISETQAIPLKKESKEDFGYFIKEDL